MTELPNPNPENRGLVSDQEFDLSSTTDLPIPAALDIGNGAASLGPGTGASVIVYCPSFWKNVGYCPFELFRHGAELRASDYSRALKITDKQKTQHL